MSRCRSCDAQIVWANHHETGTLMPIDKDPVTFLATGDLAADLAGLWVLRRKSARTSEQFAYPAAFAVKATMSHNDLTEAQALAALDDEHAWRVSHFSTCPQAATHRRTR